MKQAGSFAAAIDECQRAIVTVVHVQRLLLRLAAKPGIEQPTHTQQYEIFPAVTVIKHYDQSAARFEHAKHLVNQRIRVGDVVQYAHRADNIEMIIRKRQMLTIYLEKLPAQSGQCEPLAAEVDGGSREIDACDISAVARIMREHVAISTSDIEDLEASRGRIAVNPFGKLVRLAAILLAHAVEGTKKFGRSGFRVDACGRDGIVLPELLDAADGNFATVAGHRVPAIPSPRDGYGRRSHHVHRTRTACVSWFRQNQPSPSSPAPGSSSKDLERRQEYRRRRPERP